VPNRLDGRVKLKTPMARQTASCFVCVQGCYSGRGVGSAKVTWLCKVVLNAGQSDPSVSRAVQEAAAKPCRKRFQSVAAGQSWILDGVKNS